MSGKTVSVLSTLLFLFVFLAVGHTQDVEDTPRKKFPYKPLKLKLDEEGNAYIRFIVWHQQWFVSNNLAQEGADVRVSTQVRRSRFLAYAQVHPRFLILTHFGLNNLTPANLTSLGNNGDSPQLFLHDAWVEFKATNNEALYLGGGLHYWKGLTRLANQSTLNFMTLDNTRPFIHWHSLAVTDQFARHLGAYAKGRFGKFDYRVAWNNAGRNGIQRDFSFGRGIQTDSLLYNGWTQENEGGNTVGNSIIEGYFRYNFWDQESIKLPYQVGSYLGKKKVFGLGAGFFAHPGGVYNYTSDQHESVFHFAIDAFLEMPVGANSCLNAYAAYMNFNYGPDFVSRWAGTGNVLYGQVGYKLGKTNFMPYVAYQLGAYDGFEDNINVVDIGLNYFVLGHHAKLTLEYHTIANDIREGGLDARGNIQDIQQIRLQAHIYL